MKYECYRLQCRGTILEKYQTIQEARAGLKQFITTHPSYADRMHIIKVTEEEVK